ncbi:MAG TPA: S8 family serine peptidase [Myxococcales bacterium]|nr:S8 family serine peptidase [Myxococcales bacterium]
MRVDGAIVVDFKDGTSAEEINELEDGWGVDLELNSVEGEEDGVALAVGVEDVEGALAKIRENPDVESAEPLIQYSLPETEDMEWDAAAVGVPGSQDSDDEGFQPNDPDYGKQWNLRQIHMPKAWKESRGKGAVVAVLDTGIAYEDADDFRQVPDLKGARFAKGYDFVNDDEHANDDHGHGTHVAGTIAQVTNNKEGVAGVAFEATLMPVKVLDHFGRGTSADIADAIRWAADHGANVINMSLGGGGYSQVMADAVAYARKKGVTVICAAGNSGQGRVEYPAAYPGAVAVAAVGPDGTRAPYSSYGKELDIAAPGGNKSRGEQFGILQNTIDPQNVSRSVYAYYQGTSMATPHVAGVAALLIGAGAKTPDQVEKALFAGAEQVGGKAWTDQYGHGILNAEKSLKALKGKLEPSAEAVSPAPSAEDTSGDSAASAEAPTNWAPLAWAAGLLALVLLTLRGRARPGYLNVALKPGFLIAAVLSTVGLFFLPWLGGSHGSGVLEAVRLPIPDWEKIIFGRGKLANPLFYSALIPALASLIAIKGKTFRPLVGGLAIGFAGFLVYSVIARAPALSWLPFTFLAIPWLAVNAVFCLLIARALLKKETA